jgi:hypothetical protein
MIRTKKENIMKRPLMLWPLIFALLFLGLEGFSGGIPMLTDPANGGYLQFAHILPLLPVSNFILPEQRQV